VNSYDGVIRIIKKNKKALSVGSLKFEFSNINNIYVLGAGKATMGQAQALDEVLSNKISEGIIVVKKGQKRKLNYIDVIEGGHPIPDKNSFLGGKRILNIAKKVEENDLVFLCDSGGSSALMCHPAEKSGITFKDEQKVNELLLNCGAPIYEINAVRRHITALKGARLQELILSRGAEVINFVIPDSPRIIELPEDYSIPRKGGWEDMTTFEDAIRVLKSYDLWDKTPISIRKHLDEGKLGTIPETPKKFNDKKVHTFTLGSLSKACESAINRAKTLGCNTLLVTTVLEGESKEAGIVLASIAIEIEGNNRPIGPPCVIVFGGETTVTLKEEYGEGGPSQELALGFAKKIQDKHRITCLALDTDGTDGPTQYAGAIVDGYTMGRIKELDLNLDKNLRQHNSTFVLKKLNDTIFTGPTGTNVCDINIIAII
jgi:glycerate-2-kinase